MKKNLLVLTMLLTFLAVNAQKQNDSIANPFEKQNEVKLNAFMLLVGALELSYERNLNEESSLGISFLTPFDNENLDSDLNYYLSPYYRIFFGNKYAAGFFIEGFGMLNSIDREITSNINGNFITNEETVTDFALGFGLGGKWVTKSGFVFELSGGIGRNLFKNDYDETSLVGKFGFNLGYRF